MFKAKSEQYRTTALSVLMIVGAFGMVEASLSGIRDRQVGDEFCLFGCVVTVSPTSESSCHPGGEWKCSPAIEFIFSVPRW